MRIGFVGVPYYDTVLRYRVQAPNSERATTAYCIIVIV